MIKDRRELGQSMIIMAVAIVALIALAALIIDGGSIYLNRRRAQTAADAAAMAGAYTLCVDHGSLGQIQATVDQYAVTENGATAVESVDVDADGQVVVQTRVESPSFFASVLGYDTDMARAEAAAGCFPPASSTNLLPIAWACQPPVGGSVEECIIHSIPWDIFDGQIMPNYGSQLAEGGSLILDEGNGSNYQSYADGTGWKIPYLVMNDATFDTAQCAPPIGGGTLVCDFNNDGVLDLTGGGDRGWLAMGGGGASTLFDLILNGFSDPITVPQWLPNQPGADNSVFIKVKGRIEGNVSLVPVFNAFCPSATTASVPTDCTEYQAGDLVMSASGYSPFFRIPGFVPFVVTCISSRPNEKCPVKSYTGLDPNVSTFEGYFVDGYIAGDEIDPGGFDLGVYIVTLTR